MSETTKYPPALELGPGVVTGLAALPKDAHLDITALAKLLNRHPKTIERSARRGEIPPPIRLLGKRVWLVGAIIAYLQERQASALKKAAAHGRKIKHHAA